MIYIVTYSLFHLGLINLKIMNKYILDRHQVWRSHDPMSVQTFDFCGLYKLFFYFASFLFKLIQFFTNSTIFKKMQKDAISFHSHWLFFKKMELFVVCIFLFIHIIFFIHLGLSTWSYLPGYPPGYLMLPNLTNQFTKLSNGNLWRSSVWMKFGHFLFVFH